MSRIGRSHNTRSAQGGVGPALIAVVLLLTACSSSPSDEAGADDPARQVTDADSTDTTSSIAPASSSTVANSRDDPGTTSGDGGTTTSVAAERTGPSAELCAQALGLQGLADFDATGADPATVETVLTRFVDTVDALGDSGDAGVIALLDSFDMRAQLLLSEYSAVGFEPAEVDLDAIALTGATTDELATAVDEFGQICGVNLSGPADELEVIEDETDFDLAVEELLDELDVDEDTARCLVTELDLTEAGYDEDLFLEIDSEVCGVVPADLVDV